MVQQCKLNMMPQIIRIKNDDSMATPIILIGGFLISLWTSCIFIVGLTGGRGIYDGGLLLVLTAVASHVIIAVYATSAVFVGLQKNKPEYLKPWLFTKIAEGVFMFAGTILTMTSYWRPYVGLAPVGIILLMAGVYITLCVWSTFKKMSPPEPVSTDIPSADHLMPEQPPSYDSFTNQHNLA